MARKSLMHHDIKKIISYNYFYLFFPICKGQIISKWFFGVFDFLQKTNKNKYHSSKVQFVCSFIGRNVSLKKSFRLCLTFSSVKLEVEDGQILGPSQNTWTLRNGINVFAWVNTTSCNYRKYIFQLLLTYLLWTPK